MKLLFSVPTGYHLRELILPLRKHLEADDSIAKVFVITPAASVHEQVFQDFGSKFSFHDNPNDLIGHKKLIEQLTPDIAVTNTVGHDELDYPILKATHDIGIRTLTFIASWDNIWKIARLMRDEKPVYIADHLIVWNAMMREHLCHLFPSVSSDRISAIGAPRLDYFWQTENLPTKEELFDHLGFSDTTLPLAHLSTTELYPMDYIAKAISTASHRKELPKLNMYASVHPGGDHARHEALERFGAHVNYSFGRQTYPAHSAFAYAPTEKDMYHLVGLFKYTDVLINHSSTVALESIIANTPAINVKYGKPLDWWRWYRSMVYRDFKQHYKDLLQDDPTYVVTNKTQLLAAVKEALDNPTAKSSARDSTLRRMITTTDGTASKKVLAQIKITAQQ